jgi:multidrug resistance efflux pump
MKKISVLFKNKKFIKGFSIVLIIALGIGSYFTYEKFTDRVFIDTSLLQASIITVSPTTSGKVKEIDVRSGQKVQKGDQLAIVGTETLRADTDGLIVSASNLTGSTVNPQTQLIQMIQPVDLRVAGTIDENKGLDKIKVGQAISFTVDAFPGRTYWGYVDEVSQTSKTSQLSFSISSERQTQQFVIYAAFNATKYPELKNGMSAKMTVFTRTK